jgi:hypothetical protein
VRSTSDPRPFSARINFDGADEMVDCGTADAGVDEFIRAVVLLGALSIAGDDHRHAGRFHRRTAEVASATSSGDDLMGYLDGAYLAK